MKTRKSESLVKLSNAGNSSSGSAGGSRGSPAAGSGGAGSSRSAFSRSACFSRDQRERNPGGSAKFVLLDRRLAPLIVGGGVPLAPALFKWRVDMVASDVALHPMGDDIGDRHTLDHHVAAIEIILRLVGADRHEKDLRLLRGVLVGVAPQHIG